MSKLSHLSKFLHGRRRKKIRYLLSKFRTKSGVNTSIASLFQTAVDAVFKLRASSIEKYFLTFLAAGSIASMYVHKWNLLPIVSCMALGYISTQAILNTNPVVAAMIWICRWWQYQRDPLLIVGCTALDTFQTKQCETQSPLWRPLNRSFGGYNITEPRRWGSIIYNLASRHTFSVQLPSVRHASSKAVVHHCLSFLICK